MKLAKALIIALLLASIIGVFAMGLEFSQINDVTTTPEAPPAFIVNPEGGPKLVGLEYSSADKKTLRVSYPEIVPLRRVLGASAWFEEIEKAVAAVDSWKVVSVDRESRALQLIATTPILRFKDDLVLQVREVEGASTLHVRSRSRVGRSDLGANAKRIKQLFSLVNNK